MGKSYKKRLRQERAKVKLKGAAAAAAKAKLPKGQNLTDTNVFKVKKIVIRDQVATNRDPNELLFRNKSNLKELISRLKHHNVSIKLEALDGLKDLLSKFTAVVFETHFADILESVVKLLLDPSSDVRRPANKILSVLLSQISSEKLAPFYSSLNAYLMCCLTHIESNIREDGLRFLDALMKYSPDLCTDYTMDLLGVTLDLISNSGSGGGGGGGHARTLSVDLEGRQTSHGWRVNVLVRIRSLLNSALDNLRKGEPQRQSKREVKYVERQSQFIPLYDNHKMDFDEFQKNDSSDPSQEEVNFHKIGDSLIPLLLDMFIEVRPSEFSDDESRTNISEEAAILLQLIADIILLIDDLDKKTFQGPVGLAVKHGRHTVNVLVENHFPYAVVSSGGGGSRRKSLGKKTNFDRELTHLSDVTLNLSLVRVVLAFRNDNSKLIVPYLKSLFRNLSSMPTSELVLFSTCLGKLFQNGEVPDYFLNKIIENELCGDVSRTNFFYLLAEIALNSEFSHIHNNPKYIEWLSKLPQRLTSKKVPGGLVETISRIAARNFPSFTQSLNGLIEVILDNIPKLTKNVDATSSQIASLLYWVNEWDDDIIASLNDGLRENYWTPEVASLIRDIILTKFPRVNLEDLALVNVGHKNGDVADPCGTPIVGSLPL